MLGTGISSVEDQKRQLLTAENSLSGPDDLVMECVFPWRSQKQVAPRLWENIPCSAVSKLLPLDMCIQGLEE
jgi:hypothetical protein